MRNSILVPIDFKINPEYTKKIDEKLQPVYNKMKEIMEVE